MVTAFQFGHVGPHEYLGALNPFQILSQPSKTGIPYGTMEGRRPFYMNPEYWQKIGLTGGQSIQFLGNRDCGKTAGSKVYGYRQAGLQVGTTGYRMRPATDDTRANAGEGEYKSWAHALGSDYIDVSQYSLNITDPKMGMSIKEQSFILRSTLRMSSGDLTTTERLALRSATGIANLEAGDDLIHSDVGTVISSLKFEEHLKYLKEARRRRHDWRFNDTPDHSLRTRLDDFTNVSQTKFIEACQSVSDKFEILAEEYGEVFGGRHSMYELLRQPVVALNLTNLDEESLAMVEMILWMWRNAAIRRHDHTLMAHVEIHDENWKRWQSKEWGKNMISHLKKIRGSGTTVIKNMHRPSDILQVGSEGSIERGQAITGLRETDIWMIGQTPRSEFDQLAKYVKLPQDKLARLPMAEPGEFVVVIGDRLKPFTIYLNDITTREWAFINSNQALDERIGV